MKGYALIKYEYEALILEVGEYFRKQGLKGQPTKTNAKLKKAREGAKLEFNRLLQTEEEYWRSPEGASRGAELIAIFLVYSIANTITVAVGRKSGVAILRWVTMEDSAVCDECWALAGDYDPAGPLPEKPHYGCRCRIILVFMEA